MVVPFSVGRGISMDASLPCKIKSFLGEDGKSIVVGAVRRKGNIVARVIAGGCTLGRTAQREFVSAFLLA
jgi:hypothetical protein